MKKAFIWLLVIVLIIVGSVWGTLAYLTDKETKTNTMTIGNVDIELLEYERTALESKNEDAAVQTFTQDKPLYPAVTGDDFDYSKYNAFVDWEQIGKSEYQSDIWDPAEINNELDKMVFVKNTGDNSTYVRVFFAFEAGAYTSKEQFDKKIHLNLNDEDWTWKWEPYIAKIGNEKFFIATATYKYPLEAGDFTKISLSQISLDPTATNADVKAFNGEYNVPVFAQAIQTASFNDPFAALETGFGNDIPFEGITFDKGVTLKTALTYFEGNTAGTNIYKNVENIIFATKDAYPDVTSSHSGTLTLNDQGAPTHTYYVPSKTTEGNYDLYVLADEGKVYAPESCASLFSGMSALTTVDAKHLDVSKTKSMNNMFNNCIALSDLDVSNWDVSEVTDFANFLRCYFDHDANPKTDGLPNDKLTSLDVSNWVTASATNMTYMFSGCAKLASLDVSNFNTAKVTDMAYMFNGCSSLASLDVSNFNTAAVTTMESMFSGCSSLTSLDLSAFNTSKVKKMGSMFASCSSITEITLGAGWSTAEVTTMRWMFRYCNSLVSLDVRGWNVSKVTTMNSMFAGCTNLTAIDPSQWNVTKLENTALMFNCCYKIKSLDLSGWNPQSLTNIGQMFLDCSALEKIYVGCEWPIDQITSTNSVFRKSPKLQGGNGTKFSEYGEQGKIFAHIDGKDGKPGYFTQGPAPANP